MQLHPRVRCTLLVLALWSSGCASLPAAGRGLSSLESGARERSYRRPGSSRIVKVLGPMQAAASRRSEAPPHAEVLWAPSVTSSRQAVLRALEDVSGTLGRTTAVLARLEANRRGLTFRYDGLFSSFVEDAIQQRQWIRRVLGDAQHLVQTASEVEDPEMQRALLRLAGPRLEATLYGAQLLAAWVGFLQLVEAALECSPPYDLEHLFRLTVGAHKKLEPTMKAIASLEPERREDTVSALPRLMGELTHEFEVLRGEVELTPQFSEQMWEVNQLLKGLTVGLMMGLVVPPGGAVAPAALGMGAAVGSDGVVVGTQVAASVEWGETMRPLVQAGLIAAPVVGAAVQMGGGQLLMSQSRDGLPKGVREALGEGPEVRGMRQTGRTGAGMAESPRHHVLPREFRGWFEQRGFTGELDIDQFCVEMEQAKHEAIHGGGDWQLGRQWPGEWNRMIMKALRDSELEAGRMLTRSEILNIVTERMTDYHLARDFVPWRGP